MLIIKLNVVGLFSLSITGDKLPERNPRFTDQFALKKKVKAIINIINHSPPPDIFLEISVKKSRKINATLGQKRVANIGRRQKPSSQFFSNFHLGSSLSGGKVMPQ